MIALEDSKFITFEVENQHSAQCRLSYFLSFRHEKVYLILKTHFIQFQLYLFLILFYNVSLYDVVKQ